MAELLDRVSSSEMSEWQAHLEAEIEAGMESLVGPGSGGRPPRETQEGEAWRIREGMRALNMMDSCVESGRGK